MRSIILFLLINTFFTYAFANQTNLIQAIKAGDHSKVGRLLGRPNCVDVNAEDAFGRTPMFFASDAKMVRLLMKRGAKIHADSLGMNPLHHLFSFRAATPGSSLETLSQSCSQTAHAMTHFFRNPNPIEYQLDKFGRFPGDYLEGSWPEELVRILVNPLIFAVIRNEVQLVESLIANGMDVNGVDHLGRRAIFYVNDEHMLHTLVRHGALLTRKEGSPHIFVDYFGQNPLHSLFSMTAPNFKLYFDDEPLMKERIERVAYLLLRMQIQENGSGVMGSRARMELQEDDAGRLPGDYLRDAFWGRDFIDRIYFRHCKIYNSPDASRRVLSTQENRPGSTKIGKRIGSQPKSYE